MITRNYHIQVKLEIHALTCPGVCLCPNGGIELTIRTLGYLLTTNQAPPRFPIIFHDTFHLEGFFKTVNSLAQLEDSLRNEKVDISMWQNGRRLAYCCKTLYSILLDRPFKVTSQNYNKLLDMEGNVLMTPSSCFPGIIGPRVEYSSRVKLLQPDYDLSEPEDGQKDRCCNRKCGRLNCDASEFKQMCDAKIAKSKEFRRQKPVCHYSENAQAERDKRYHSEKQHRNFTHKNFESKKFHCDCVRDFDDSSSVNILVENHSHQQYQYPQQTMAPILPSISTKTLKNHENFNELKTVTNTAQPIVCHRTSCPQESKNHQHRYSHDMQRSNSNSSPSNSMSELNLPDCGKYLKELHDKCRRYLYESDLSHSPLCCATCTKYRRTFNLK